MKQVLFLVGVLLLLLPLPLQAAPDLPFAAGLCVNKANLLIREEKIGPAIALLEAFEAKQQGFDPQTAAQKGYDHYYIDFLLGNCFLLLDQKEKNPEYVKRAIAAFSRAVEKNNSFSPAWLNLARCCYELADMARAAAAFAKGYETSLEKKGEYLYYAAVCHTATQNYGQALAVFNRLLADHPKEITLEWKETLVNIFFSLEKYAQALPWLQELAENSVDKKKKTWQEILLYQYLTLKMDKKALEYALFLTRTDPLEPKWWKALTHIHLDKNRLEDGLSSLIIYSFITPLSQQETTLMADLYLACNIPLKAAEYYETWLEIATDEKIKPQNKDVDPDKIQDRVAKLSQAYLSGGNPAAAQKALDRLQKTARVQ
ncbi:MAG: tetratricopeptide repeat protein [Proteobacteria bacterium]|nr:tetratricopeptide repeat protein [Desulfobacula sp.]MBU3951967.1 tetratricopeptide repeat protein [Pseudomonadota bacterium]MBU4130492.1 tetratricopeptide repeat protein [Pseudomonadota bacterium]